MGALDGRVCIITGAGRGIGREHALLFSREGANVIVNDLGGAIDGSGLDMTPAQSVAGEITTAGGQAVASTDSVADWHGARRIVNTAIDAFGDLHVVVNNAGIMRGWSLPTMTEDKFDAVIAVNLKGMFNLSRWAAAYWLERAQAGVEAQRAIVNTSSGAGLHGNPGQVNYAAAKAGIAAMTVVFDPENISPLAAALAAEGCPFNGQVFSVVGGSVGIYAGWSIGDEVTSQRTKIIEAIR